MLLKTPLMEKLEFLRLKGMLAGLEQQLGEPDLYTELGFEERLGMLVDKESEQRHTKQLGRRLKNASLVRDACMANLDYKLKRTLDKGLIRELGKCTWVNKHQNIIFIGKTGIGKSFIASALCHQACIEGYNSYFIRVHRLFEKLAQARADGSYLKIMTYLNKQHILILDDFGIATLDGTARRDFLEIMEDRYKERSTIITSQYPIKTWHQKIGDPTLADAILDRLVHNAHRFDFEGDSARKEKNNLTD